MAQSGGTAGESGDAGDGAESARAAPRITDQKVLLRESIVTERPRLPTRTLE